MFTLIKCIAGGLMVGGGMYLQNKARKEGVMLDFLQGMEFVLAGVIIVFTT